MEKLKTKIGILLLGAITLSPLVITSAFGAIIGQFASQGVPVPRVQLIATIPNLAILLFSIIVGRLALSISAKRIGQIGLALVAAGGLLPLAFYGSINQLLAWAFIMGIGICFCGVAAPTLISMYFGGDERMGMMGMLTASNSIGRMFMVTVGGYLGSTIWVNTYWVFISILVLLILFSILVPNEKPVPVPESDKQGNKPSLLASYRNLSRYVFLVGLVAFMISFFYTVYPTNVSILIEAKGLGGTEIAGLISGVGTVGGLVAGFTMKWSKRVLKTKVLPLGFTFTALSFFAILYSDNVIVLAVASMLTTVGTAFIFSTLPFMISILSHPSEIAVGMGAMNTLNSLGKLICPIVLGWFNVQAGEQQFLVGGIGFAIVAIVLFATNFGDLIQKNRFKKESFQTEKEVLV